MAKKPDKITKKLNENWKHWFVKHEQKKKYSV